MKSKKVQGVGTYDMSGISTDVSYKVWSTMLQRCYSPKCHIKHLSYIGCSVCEDWLLFSNFKKWHDENYIEGFSLDKDILVEGNKIYSPNTCRYVPNYLNNILVLHVSRRGNMPLGVTELLAGVRGKINSTFLAQCNDGYGKQTNKTFKTIEEAKLWYSETKKKVVKAQAQRAFLDNAIKTDVYLALVRREF